MFNMYADDMENNMQKVQYYMSRFSKSLTSVQNGTNTFEDIKEEVEEIKYQLYLLCNRIDALDPPDNLITLHNTVKEGCNTYIDGVNEFLKYYLDGNDEHFVTGGLKIQKGTQLMHRAADMF